MNEWNKKINTSGSDIIMNTVRKKVSQDTFDSWWIYVTVLCTYF